jgi:hypothetical protein
MSEEYNGWANRSTWNVALCIQNTEDLYKQALAFMNKEEHKKITNPYKYFILDANMKDHKTGDGIKFYSTSLDYKALDEMMRELIND